jgi:hypothetical protein
MKKCGHSIGFIFRKSNKDLNVKEREKILEAGLAVLIIW